MSADKPFHVAGHHVERQPDKAWFEVLMNNRPLFKHKIQLSRAAARKIADALNTSAKARVFAARFPLKDTSA
jgi:hypothetical protein